MRYRKTCALYDEVNMGNPGNVSWCSDKGLEPDCENCTRPDETNADRIRGMTDEELAHFMTPENYKFPCPQNHNDCQYELIPCWMCWAMWLKAPVENEE